jgi:arylsulfatase A-like enzyme
MYAEFVSTVDEMIGQVITHLDERGLRDNTLIIFLSDHGHSVEQRTFGGGGSSGPYRGHKFTLWEGGIRVPCIVSGPGRIPRNTVREQVTTSLDWFPTIAQYCDAALPERKIDGKSIVRVIESANTPSPHEALHWETGKHWAVRRGNWKLVHNGPATNYKGRRIPQAPDFLSDLAEDVTETKNLADQHPRIVEELKKLHAQWAEDVRHM